MRTVHTLRRDDCNRMRVEGGCQGPILRSHLHGCFCSQPGCIRINTGNEERHRATHLGDSVRIGSRMAGEVNKRRGSTGKLATANLDSRDDQRGRRKPNRVTSATSPFHSTSPVLFLSASVHSVVCVSLLPSHVPTYYVPMYRSHTHNKPQDTYATATIYPQAEFKCPGRHPKPSSS